MKYKINLLPTPEKTLFDKVIFFSFNYLRYILVITQLIVLGVFSYKFTVDQQIIDLKEELKQKQEIVKVSQPLIQEAMIVEKKTQYISQLLNSQDTFKEMITYYYSRFPQGITATRINIEGPNIDLEGTITDVTILQNFYNRLKLDGKFQELQIVSLSKTDNGYTFVLSLKLYKS